MRLDHVIPRVYLDDPNLRPQTRAHHITRYKFAAEHFTLKSGTCLDLMCGSGYGTEILRQTGASVIGVDNDLSAIHHAKIHYPRCLFFTMDVRDISVHSFFSTITWFEGIEHVERERGHDTLRRCARALREDGTLVVSTPRDLNARYNRWHLSDWSLDALRATTNRWFSDVMEYGQDWDTAVISQEDVVANDFYILVCRK